MIHNLLYLLDEGNKSFSTLSLAHHDQQNLLLSHDKNRINTFGFFIKALEKNHNEYWNIQTTYTITPIIGEQ